MAHSLKTFFPLAAVALLMLSGVVGAEESNPLSKLLPEDVSTYGGKVDALFYSLIYSTGLAFLCVLAALAYFCIRYRAREGRTAEYTHGNSWKALAVTGTLAMLVFTGIDMNTVRMSNAAAREMQHPPENAMRVQVLAQQFSWTFRLPGPDGKFGRADMSLVDSFNMFGIDPKDPAGKDDIVNEGGLCVPVNTPVVLEMRSKDVIHSFFLPHFRTKQDVVPGMKTQMWFQATRTGDFEIVCAELCGMLHSQMAGLLQIRDQKGFEDWLKQKAEEN